LYLVVRAIITRMDLSELNENQKLAVTSGLGPVLLLAGPGSGKTKTLTHRIAYIIEQKMFRPEQILALTFTNKASKEMRERVGKLIDGKKTKTTSSSAELTMGTFHSICARLLRREITALGYGVDFVIFDTDDQQKVLREICDDLRLDKKFPPSLFSAYISKAKNLLQMPSELDLGLESPFAEKLAEVYTRYQDSLYRQNALDFDDLLMLMVKVLQNFPKVLEKYQKQFAYVLVDEYQDTNLAQYTLLKLLSEHHNLFVVGDDAQSIYGFRGSDITNILNFEKDFPECTIIKLEQNYRSTAHILSAAQKVIEMNSEQKQKTLWTQNSQGEKVQLHRLTDERAEAEFVAQKIIEIAGGKEAVYVPEEQDYKGYSILDRFLQARKLHGSASMKDFRKANLPQLPKEHLPLKEFCILYRTHAQSRSLEEVMIESSIPYQIIGGLKFYERKEIKDMLAYLRLCLNFGDMVSLKRVINEPARGIGDKSYQIIRDFILNYKDAHLRNEDSSPEKSMESIKAFRVAFSEIKLSPKIWQSAQDFFLLLEDFANLAKENSLPELMRLIVRRSGYEKYLRDGSEKGESRWENVQELFTVAGKFKNLNWREGAVALLEEVALMAEIDNKDDKRDVVTLMTLHSAKGLEFDNVFFVGLEEGVLPHSRSLLSQSELAEEVRLAYVGLTRARKKLFVTCVQSRMSFGNRQIQTPSRILNALPETSVEFFGIEPAVEGELTVEEMEF
jgi:DNA helicase II / ATP-dependent DNA helicase PcrA